MKKIFILFLFMSIFFASAQSWGYDIQATLEPIGGAKNAPISPALGEPFEAELKIWPFGNAILSEVKKIEGTTFLDFFYVAKIDKIEFSPNNEQVVVIQGIFVITQNFGQAPFYIWSYKAVNIPVEIKGISSKPFKPQAQTFLITDQEVDTPFRIPAIVWFILGFLALILYLIYRFYQKRQMKKKAAELQRQNREAWAQEIRKAKKRKDYEKIYSVQREWNSFFDIDEKELRKFSKTLKEHMYKPKWGEEDLEAVETSYKGIRGAVD